MTADAVGGIWTYATDLAGALTTFGIEVTVAVVGPGLDETKRRAATEAGFAIVDLGYPPEWLAEGPEAVRRGGVALADLARDAEVDLVHLNHPSLNGGTTFGCPTLAVCHSCVATWWTAVRGTPLPHDLAWQAGLVGAGYRSATTLVAPSRAFARATQEAYGLGQQPEVVFNGRSAPATRPSASEVRGGLTAGRLWDEGKDIATLDCAAALTTVPIRAVGPMAGPHGASVSLHHLEAGGTASEAEVRTLLAERPVYLSAARYEPFGLSVLEAAQAGCALVLTDIPTFRELWSEAALFIPSGDAAGFAAALDRLTDDPSLRSRLGAAAQDRAKRYTLAATVDRLLRFYAAMLGRDLVGTKAELPSPEPATAVKASRNAEAA